MTSVTTKDLSQRGNDPSEFRDAAGKPSSIRLRPYLRFAKSGLYRFRVPQLRFNPFRVQ